MARVVITVVAPRQRMDLAVSDETTVAALVPLVVDLCAVDRTGTWTLAPKGGRPLVPNRTLRDGGVLHGAIVLLEPAAAVAVAGPKGRRVELVDLLGAGDRPEAHIVACWIRDRTVPGPRRLRAALGVDAAGRPVDLDLGHVVVSGAAGTGKTELLRAIVASLAARHTPLSVRLLLVGSFPGLAGLPHAVERSGEEGLEAELRRREPGLVVALDEPRSSLRGRLLAILARSGPDGTHVLVATREPRDVLTKIGPALTVAMGPACGSGVVTDAMGRSWAVQAAGTSSLPHLVQAIGAVSRALRR